MSRIFVVFSVHMIVILFLFFLIYSFLWFHDWHDTEIAKSSLLWIFSITTVITAIVSCFRRQN